MTIELRIIFEDSRELAIFADWYDQRSKDGGAKTLIEQIPDLPKLEPAKKTAEPKPEPVAKKKPEPKPEPTPEATAIKPEDFQKAIKAWYAEDPTGRGPAVKSTIDTLGVKRLQDIPEDQMAAVLTNLGLL